MKTTVATLIALATTTLAATEMEQAKELGWPDWRGPFHRSGIDGGHTLIDNHADAKLVWKSEEPIRHKYDLGYGGCSQWPGGACGHSGPIYWDGNVYINYCQPKQPWPEGREGQRTGMKETRLIDCDEIVLCMDAKTGKTVWKTVFEGKGINYAWGKAGGHFVPVIRYGNIYALTTGGYARCLDAKTGKEKWTYELPAAAAVKGMKASVKEKGDLRKASSLNRAMCRNPAVAAGVAAFQGGGGKSGSGGALIGIDAHTGKKLWEGRLGAVYVSPVVWRPSDPSTTSTGSGQAGSAQAREYFINQYSCLDPRTGRVLWTAEAKQNNGHSTAIGEHNGAWYMLVGSGKPKVDLSYVRNDIAHAKRKGKPLPEYHGNQCFKITPEGAELVWELPEQYGANATPAIYKGKVWFDSQVVSEEHETAKWKRRLCRVDLETGKVEAETKSGGRHYASISIADDTIVKPSGGEKGHRILSSKPDALTCSEIWPISHMEGGTSVLVDGRFYIRGLDAVYCYDLRAAAKP